MEALARSRILAKVLSLVKTFLKRHYLRQLVLRIVRIGGHRTIRLRRLTGPVAVGVILVGEVSILGELIACLKDGHAILGEVAVVLASRLLLLLRRALPPHTYSSDGPGHKAEPLEVTNSKETKPHEPIDNCRHTSEVDADE